VVEKLDAEQLAGGREPAHEGDVLGRGLGVSGCGEFPITGVRRTSGYADVAVRTSRLPAAVAAPDQALKGGTSA
jgi:hypothetical protein